eukprot:TRINITY_DN5654_c0_g1_i1.p1 TRINITY_DN5654_c0_g1~~TRINITY_DN5654_c0_g1_i1.p1  ORF type:complete len:208 (-),score=79.72 TRINITY_DN5654_c0_g1_i1:89-712(-)
MDSQQQLKDIEKKIFLIQNQFSSVDFLKKKNELSEQLEQQILMLTKLNSQTSNDVRITKRETTTRRIDTLLAQCRGLLNELNLKKRLEEEEQIRQQLFQDIPKNNFNNNGHVELSMRENESLIRSNREVDDMLQTGQSALESLVFQKETLKGSQRKLFDFYTQLGISNSLVRRMQQKHSTDRLILYGGMIFTLLFFGFCYYYFRYQT